MLTVFAVWGLAGFGYPSEPVPYALNVVSKILAFVTALSLFFGKGVNATAHSDGFASRSRVVKRDGGV